MKAPKHIAVILDGNRRFAKRIMAKPWEGHKFGKEKVKKLLKWCAELGIKEVSLYAFSVDNFKRPRQEFNYLMKLFKASFIEALNDKELKKEQVRIKFVGRLSMFPKDVVDAMKELSERTRHYKKFIVNFCMAYGGREEITDAAKRMASDAVSGKLPMDKITDSTLKDYLYLKSDPDMIIRTGGEKRLSGFLLYQASYSELFFLDKMWPDFSKNDLVKCVQEFKMRERRFGR